MEAIENLHMPLFFAAPLGWYGKIWNHPEIMLINDHKFPKQTNRHKLNYVSIEGVQGFSIPLVKDTRNLDYKSVEISYQAHWQNQLINALKTSYGKTPFFEYYDYRFEKIIAEPHQYLWDLNYKLLQETLDCLRSELKLSVFNAGAYVADPELMAPEKQYYQVFADKIGFKGGVTILDLIFNEGIDAWRVFEPS